MFAVIRTGGKQYRVAKDDRISVERLAGAPGTMIQLADVLMLGGDGQAPTIGRPAVDKAAVFAEVLEHNRADKVLVFKKKRRNNYRRKAGHRQDQTLLRIVGVSPTGEAPAFTPTPKKEPRPEAKPEKKVRAEAASEAEADEETKPARKAEEKAAPKRKAKAKKEARPKKKAAAKAKAPAKKKPAKGKSKE